mmetsp:Transcript_10691/g.43242  ORF Transcript_10691/g.43242 Transcript_10691/m.43242 type:complete len:201 (-) Transcript_10691:876-1478(-)
MCSSVSSRPSRTGTAPKRTFRQLRSRCSRATRTSPSRSTAAPSSTTSGRARPCSRRRTRCSGKPTRCSFSTAPTRRGSKTSSTPRTASRGPSRGSAASARSFAGSPSTVSTSSSRPRRTSRSSSTTSTTWPRRACRSGRPPPIIRLERLPGASISPRWAPSRRRRRHKQALVVFVCAHAGVEPLFVRVVVVVIPVNELTS